MFAAPSPPESLADLFGDPEVSDLLSERAQLAAMIRFEIALARVESRLGVIPGSAGFHIEQALDDFQVDRSAIRDGTARAGVPMPALVVQLRAQVGEPYGTYVHWGATSQDVVDTAFILQTKQALDVLQTRLDTLVDLLADKARLFADLPMAGRTRSQIATPITLGLRIAGWRGPLVRCRARLDELSKRLLVVQFGGASGSLGALRDRGIEVMDALAVELDLGTTAKPWHTERDTIVELAGWLSLVTGALGRIGGDLVLTGRSEIGELSAGTGGGSSTMPQKANPVLAETLVTIARHNAGMLGTAHQALLHQEERDASAWALEWMTVPQMLVSTGAALRHARTLIETLSPSADRMNQRLTADGGLILAEAASFALAAHMPLQEAQALVKRAVSETRTSGKPLIAVLASLTDAPVNWDTFDHPGKFTGSARALIERSLTD